MYKFESDKIAFQFLEEGQDSESCIGANDMEELVKALDTAARVIRKFALDVSPLSEKLVCHSDAKELEAMRRRYMNIVHYMHAEMAWSGKP